MRIDEERSIVIRYRDTEQNLFAKEPEIKKAIKTIEQRLAIYVSVMKTGGHVSGKNVKKWKSAGKRFVVN